MFKDLTVSDLDVVDTVLEFKAAENEEDGSEEGDGVQQRNDPYNDSVAELSAVGTAGHGNAVEGRDKQVDAEDEHGGGKPDEVVAPEPKLRKVIDLEHHIGLANHVDTDDEDDHVEAVDCFLVSRRLLFPGSQAGGTTNAESRHSGVGDGLFLSLL